MVKETLQTLQEECGDKEFNTYKALKLVVVANYDQLLNRLEYMERAGFLDARMRNGGRFFHITKKGYDLIHAKPEREVVEVESVKRDKTPLQQIREERIIGILKNGIELDKKEITKKLDRYEKVTHDLVYQMLRPMVEAGTVKVRKEKRTNYYSLPECEPMAEEAPIEEVVIHEPTEVLNHAPKEPMPGTAEPPKNNGVSIGQIVDRVWPYCTSMECRKPSKLKNHNLEAVMARFKDQNTLLQVFNELPPQIRQDTKITIESKHKKVQLLIPLQ